MNDLQDAKIVFATFMLLMLGLFAYTVVPEILGTPFAWLKMSVILLVSFCWGMLIRELFVSW